MSVKKNTTIEEFNKSNGILGFKTTTNGNYINYEPIYSKEQPYDIYGVGDGRGFWSRLLRWSVGEFKEPKETEINFVWFSDTVFAFTGSKKVKDSVNNIGEYMGVDYRTTDTEKESVVNTKGLREYLKSLGFVETHNGSFINGFVKIEDLMIMHDMYPTKGKPTKIVGDIKDYIDYFKRL